MPSKISNYDQIINALASGSFLKYFFTKDTQTQDSISAAPSFAWRAAGIPIAGAVPATGSGTVPTSSTNGAFVLQNPAAGKQRYLTNIGTIQVDSATNGYAMLIDVLWFNSGLSGTSASAQTINSLALTRYTSGKGNRIALIDWTATGATNSNVTVSYTNENGTSGRTTVSTPIWSGNFSHGANAPVADQWQELPLQDGDYGVQSIQSLTLSGTTGSAGDFGVVIFHPIAFVNRRGFFNQINQLGDGLPEIMSGACLNLIRVTPNSTSTNKTPGFLTMVDV